MTAPVYIYPASRSGAAALHLLNRSMLVTITERRETFWAGANAVEVTLSTPFPSSGETILWDALNVLSREHGRIDVPGALERLEPSDLRALHHAIGIGLGVIEVGAPGVTC